MQCVEGSETTLERWSAIYSVLACMTFGIDSVFGQRFAHVPTGINHDLAVFCLQSMIGFSGVCVLDCGAVMSMGREYDILIWVSHTIDQC